MRLVTSIPLVQMKNTEAVPTEGKGAHVTVDLEDVTVDLEDVTVDLEDVTVDLEFSHQMTPYEIISGSSLLVCCRFRQLSANSNHCLSFRTARAATESQNLGKKINIKKNLRRIEFLAQTSTTAIMAYLLALSAANIGSFPPPPDIMLVADVEAPGYARLDPAGGKQPTAAISPGCDSLLRVHRATPGCDSAIRVLRALPVADRVGIVPRETAWPHPIFFSARPRPHDPSARDSQ
ncbi:hypothetical protein PRIPAC_71184, partial [Pristionchus pacificus]|uniref:Uncharacterized protein n=1 Tax=Pristionchus pacificus TaxID=54126 RepID=A0A2A6C0B6_PRIPA